ncbi:hypothetical protein M758_2G121500 [Ceratodon purpureus]|nr:hypothetical protein M758_2G121500 [Ceratodon purpureus]
MASVPGRPPKPMKPIASGSLSRLARRTHQAGRLPVGWGGDSGGRGGDGGTTPAHADFVVGGPPCGPPAVPAPLPCHARRYLTSLSCTPHLRAAAIQVWIDLIPGSSSGGGEGGVGVDSSCLDSFPGVESLEFSSGLAIIDARGDEIKFSGCWSVSEEVVIWRVALTLCVDLEWLRRSPTGF